MATLMERLEQTNLYFKRMTDLIPPEIYFENNEHKRKRQNKEDGGPLTKSALRALHKKMRLDPNQYKTVTELQEDMAREEEPDSDDEQVKKPQKKIKGKQNRSEKEDLRQRLQAKIQQMKAVRKAPKPQDLATQRSKRQAKKERQKQRKKTANKTGTQTKGKVFEEGTAAKKPDGTPVLNQEGKLVFSKFDFTSDVASSKKKGKEAPKHLKKLLAKAEDKKQKIKDLKNENLGKAHEVEQKSKWKSALQKAQGVKLKDDPELLKKSIKRKDQIKKKSKKQWKERKDQVEANIKKKQNKRSDNLKARKQQKVSNKIKKAKKKGRVIPGF
ncbi:SURF6 [Branchiostoma lanceolatum]|uniref:SURF6 protein n=1 Tax=Branchiostoma lanceolatum TaxID=7740 RepID=A0A8K0A8L4_BRALA|nr:SURF6 [Branchiostoma lanceolatum]